MRKNWMNMIIQSEISSHLVNSFSTAHYSTLTKTIHSEQPEIKYLTQEHNGSYRARTSNLTSQLLSGKICPNALEMTDLIIFKLKKMGSWTMAKIKPMYPTQAPQLDVSRACVPVAWPLLASLSLHLHYITLHFIYLFVCLFVCSSIYTFVYAFIQSFIYLFI